MPQASFATVLDWIGAGPPGRRVIVPSGLSESQMLIDALTQRPEAADGAVFAGLFIPGVNSFDYASLHPGAAMETPLLAGHLRASFEAGRVRPHPFSYWRAYQHLSGASGLAEVGLAVVTPGPGNTFSCGLAADAAPAVLAGAKRKVALVNADAPRIDDPSRTVHVPRDVFDCVVPIEEPLRWVAPEPAPKGALAEVARRAAALIRDGDVLQFGIGKLPGAILQHLSDRRDLKIHSGLYAEGVGTLLDAGALSEEPDALLAGVALGSEALGARLARLPQARFASVAATHAPAGIAKARGFTAINGALQVDLFGQVNSEFLGGKLFAGPGGLPDFVAGAGLAPEGRAIIALPATAGVHSRIVTRLESPFVTLARGAPLLVVTEFGVADLRGLGLDQVAEALIGIADPAHQAALSQSWRAVRTAL